MNDWLKDRADPRVVEGLGRRCGICHAQPGHDCHHPWETSEPFNRVIHQERAEQAMDR